VEKEIRNNYLKILYETKSGNDKIIGMHYLGESAANIIQGYSVSFNQGLHLKDLQQSCYIHPC